MDSKNYECVIMQVTKGALMSARNAPKAFGGRTLPGPAGGANSTPPDSQLDLRLGVGTGNEGRENT